MTNKHTPGPWHVLPKYTNKDVYPIGYPIDANAHSILAEVNSLGGTEESCIANARLIASAPELLAACEAMLAWMQSHALDTVKATPNALPECIAVKQAIAKATGSK